MSIHKIGPIRVRRGQSVPRARVRKVAPRRKRRMLFGVFGILRQRKQQQQRDLQRFR